MKFGIIGYGRFGKLWANALLPYGSIQVFDKNIIEKADSPVNIATLKEVAASSDVLFILVPISDFGQVCNEIKPLLNKHTLVVDCCSVKIFPTNIMQQVFDPGQPLLGTHPLFGPDSVKRHGGLQGHKIVMCPVRCSEALFGKLEKIFSDMGLKVIIANPETHDKEMANSQGLVHFIGRGLAALNLQPQEISTPDFQALLNINQMVINDTWRLFLDMHQYNPYAKLIREKFLHQLSKLNEAIDHGRS